MPNYAENFFSTVITFVHFVVVSCILKVIAPPLLPSTAVCIVCMCYVIAKNIPRGGEAFREDR